MTDKPLPEPMTHEQAMEALLAVKMTIIAYASTEMSGQAQVMCRQAGDQLDLAALVIGQFLQYKQVVEPQMIEKKAQEQIAEGKTIEFPTGQKPSAS